MSAIVEMVEAGQTVTITKRGKPVANIVAANAVPIKPKMDLDALRFRASIPALDTSGVAMIRRRRDGEL